MSKNNTVTGILIVHPNWELIIKLNYNYKCRRMINFLKISKSLESMSIDKIPILFGKLYFLIIFCNEFFFETKSLTIIQFWLAFFSKSLKRFGSASIKRDLKPFFSKNKKYLHL